MCKHISCTKRPEFRCGKHQNDGVLQWTRQGQGGGHLWEEVRRPWLHQTAKALVYGDACRQPLCAATHGCTQMIDVRCGRYQDGAVLLSGHAKDGMVNATGKKCAEPVAAPLLASHLGYRNILQAVLVGGAASYFHGPLAFKACVAVALLR